MNKNLLYLFFVILFISCSYHKNVPDEKKTLDSMLLSMLQRYESGLKPTGSIVVPYPDSVLVIVRATVGDVSICEYLEKLGIAPIMKPGIIGYISCYIKPKHLRALVNWPYLESVQVVIPPSHH
jgi:hypothetical protein